MTGPVFIQAGNVTMRVVQTADKKKVTIEKNGMKIHELEDTNLWAGCQKALSVLFKSDLTDDGYTKDLTTNEGEGQ